MKALPQQKPKQYYSNSHAIYDHDNYRPQIHELLYQIHIINTFVSQDILSVTYKLWA